MSNRSGNFGLWAVSVRNGKPAGGLTTVKADIGRSVLLGWTAAGTLFYMSQQEKGSRVVISGLTPPVTAAAQAGRGAQQFAGTNPSWSPDGKLIAFTRWKTADGALDLVVQSLESGEERVFTHKGLRGHPPLWSPDNSAVLVSAFPSTPVKSPIGRTWWRVDLSSGRFTEVLAADSERTRSGFAALAPDGSTLYFAAGPPVDRPQDVVWDSIIAVDLRSKTERIIYRLQESLEGQRTGPMGLDVSPDGFSLAILMANQHKYQGRLLRVGVDGTGRRELYGPFRFFGPAITKVQWSRDGSEIVFARADEQVAKFEIMRISSAGGSPVFTGITTSQLGALALSPDAKQIAYSTSSGLVYQLWALDNVLAETQTRP